MGELANIAMISQGTAAAGGAANAWMQSDAIKQQGSYQESVAATNKRLALIGAKDATKRGQAASDALLRDAGGLIGTQRAKYAGQGVDVNAGSAAEVQADTAAQAARDAEMISNNAYREAWGLRVEAANYASQGRFGKMAAENQANSTLLTGGLGFSRDMMQAAYMYAQLKNPTVPSYGGGLVVKPPAGKTMSDPRNR